MHCNFTPFPTLTTDRMVLRRIDLSDDNEIFYERSDKTINEFIDRAPAATIEDARNWITMISNLMANNEGVTWGLTLKGDPKLMGGFCFWNFSKENNTADAGFSLHPEHWGKGLMQEARDGCIPFGFEVMQLSTIVADTHFNNIRSRKLLERNGFVFQGPGDNNYVIYHLGNPAL